MLVFSSAVSQPYKFPPLRNHNIRNFTTYRQNLLKLYVLPKPDCQSLLH